MGDITSRPYRPNPDVTCERCVLGVENMPNGVLAVGYGNLLRVNWKLGFALSPMRFSGDSVLSLKPTVRPGRRLAYPRLRG